MEESWRGTLLCGLAIIDAKTAWQEAHMLDSFDAGASKANMLHWIATRPLPSVARSGEKHLAQRRRTTPGEVRWSTKT